MISLRPSLVFLFVWIIESLFLSSYTTDDVIDILRDDGPRKDPNYVQKIEEWFKPLDVCESLGVFLEGAVILAFDKYSTPTHWASRHLGVQSIDLLLFIGEWDWTNLRLG
ncbi:hypothetical protein FRACYDRAFT_233307 [Fragilariopsis cylindrus CCMP1102]|uniref:Uncharacterized protein n=1 Tax=Fragilariopsis cylindrus CCMP1102 TaxID=635003 RepID=A0A1E7FYB9_9STRA|nr:hypothetical protein FRACYDRAFT_233307 [Fragilariopsis cylindrus CCMP1102]|eukprot:OEU23140.1 hypothetical protein FRACYDRAFT_233307 [Fragilariopsis cylindrus CCMP1102]